MASLLPNYPQTSVSGSTGTVTATGGTTGSLKKSAKATAPSPTLTGLPEIDALIQAQMLQIQTQSKIARKSLLQSRKAFKQENRQAKSQNLLLQQQIAALQVQPAPQVTSPNMAEVSFARRQTAVDAGARLGMRKSILAGETGGFRGSSGAPGARSSILG